MRSSLRPPRPEMLSTIRRAASWLLARSAYGLAVLPVLTDWIDTGAWPHHPREYATEVVVGLVILYGVSRLRRRVDLLEALSTTDALTGLGNRARFRADLDDAVASAHEQHAPLSLAIIDIDRFKSINDTLGHGAGDDALREVATCLARSIREGVDGCYRLGGDEFAVLMQGMEPSGMHARMRTAFARAEKTLGEALSCSVGIVALASGESAESFVHRADVFMYEAKRGNAGTADGGRSHAFGRITLRGTADAHGRSAADEDEEATRPEASRRSCRAAERS